MRTEDGHIVRKCIAGDEKAFRILVERYQKSVYALAYSKLMNFQDAEEVTQDAFIKAYKNLKKLKNIDSFTAWMYSITANLCSDRIGEKKRQFDKSYIGNADSMKLVDKKAVDSYISEQYREFNIDYVHKILNNLPEKYRKVLSMYYLSNLKVEEIARFLGMSNSGVRKRLERARNSFKEINFKKVQEEFDRNRLPAGFTLQIMDLIGQTRIMDLPRSYSLPFGLSTATGIVIFMVGLIQIPGIVHKYTLEKQHGNFFYPAKTKLIDNSEIFIDIIDTSIPIQNPYALTNGKQVADISQKALFVDNFDSNDVSDWQGHYYSEITNKEGIDKENSDDKSLVEIAVDAVETGNPGLRFVKSKQIGSHAVVSSPDLGSLDGKIHIDFDFKADKYNHIFMFSQKAPYKTENEEETENFGFSLDHGTINLRSTCFSQIGYYNPNDLYHVTITADIASNSFDIEISGNLQDMNNNPQKVLKVYGVNFRRPVPDDSSIKHLNLYTGSKSPPEITVGIDNLVIKDFTDNNPPKANFICPGNVITGEKITFDGTDSYDPDNDYIAFLWDFGDGKKSYGPRAVHTYNTPGKYTVNLTVTDKNGGINKAKKLITVYTLSSKL
ncbi:sigma-70 family RNA polymerase sigma factor [Candidatus Poribacteria bacterium]|nr:sigma-70 family RNA polymerase sigma factor [Candidatus Poribacteria bacterium]